MVNPPSRPPSVPDHELLRVVGRGSYGEVWLARNVMGVLRAVKVIRRARFDRDRPYDREFKGIERYEPLSRTSDGLVQVLHVGRNEREGFFYYVMELADDAAGGVGRVREGDGIVTTHYVPRTLRLDLDRMGRLPVEECTELGRTLATGLAQLHRHRLVHRDLKPSNIVFVNGRAKLADLGLVAGLDESRSFVGTEGFVPPEGPGKPAADLFALGRVLYQASTGLDPARFPEIPGDWLESADATASMEFHEVVLKLGEHDAERRYRDAAEVLADLAVIQSGRSVRELRALRRRVAVFRGVGAVAVAGLLLAGVAGWWARREALREHGNFVRISRAEQAARTSLVNARLEQARALRLAGGIGSRDAGLEVLTNALVSEPSPAQRRALRGEAAATLAHLGTRWVPAPAQIRSLDAMAVALDARQEWSMRHERDGTLVVRALADGREIGRLPALNPIDDEAVGFSPTRRFVLLRRGEEYVVGDLEGGGYCRTNGACGFVARRDELWCAVPGGGLERVSLPEGRVLQSLGPLPGGQGAARVWRRVVPAPAGNRVATSASDDEVILWDTESGVASERLGLPSAAYALAWSPDALRLAVGTVQGELRYWELPDPVARWTLSLHATAVRRLAFDPQGGILAAAMEGETLKLLDAVAGREIADVPAMVWNLAFRPDDGRLALVWRGGEPGFIEVLGPESVRVLPRAWGSASDGVLAYGDGGRWLLVGTSGGLEIVEARSGQSVAFHPGRQVRAAAFDEAGGRVVWLDDDGLAWVAWPGGTNGTASRPIRESGRGWTHFAFGKQHGVMLLADGVGESLQVRVGDRVRTNVSSGQFIRFTAITGDGRVGATGNLSGRDVQLWDLAAGRAGARVASGLNVRPTFSGDGRWLVTTGPTASVWRIAGSGAEATPGPGLPEAPANTVAGSAAFSGDGVWLAVVYGDREVRLFRMPEAAAGLSLEGPSRSRVVALAFASDGGQLAAATVEGDLFVWDLGRLERLLMGMGLGE